MPEGERRRAPWWPRGGAELPAAAVGEERRTPWAGRERAELLREGEEDREKKVAARG
jgi:hypothetical protein